MASGSAQRRRTLFRALLLLLSAVIIANGQTTLPEITPCPAPAPATNDSAVTVTQMGPFCYHLPPNCSTACSAKVTIEWDPVGKYLTFTNYMSGVKTYTAAGVSQKPDMGPGFAVACIRESETNITSRLFVVFRRGELWPAVDHLAPREGSLSDVVTVATATEAKCTFNMTIPFLAIPHFPVYIAFPAYFIYASGASNDSDSNGWGVDKHGDMLKAKTGLIMLSQLETTTRGGGGAGAGGASSGHVHQSSAWTLGVVVVVATSVWTVALAA